MAVAGDIYAGFGVLTVAREARRAELKQRLPLRQRQRHDLGPSAQRVETGAHRRVRKVIDIKLPRQRQRRDQARSGGERLVCHQLVAALGQRRQHHQRQRGEIAPELSQEIPHALPDRLDFAGGDVAMAGDADDQGSHVASGR